MGVPLAPPGHGGEVLGKTADWFMENFPFVEPWFVGPHPQYNWSPCPETFGWMMPVLYYKSAPNLSALKEVFFSAATAGPRLIYDPVGQNDAAWSGTDAIYRGLWALSYCWKYGVPANLWGPGLAIGGTTSYLRPRRSGANLVMKRGAQHLVLKR